MEINAQRQTLVVSKLSFPLSLLGEIVIFPLSRTQIHKQPVPRTSRKERFWLWQSGAGGNRVGRAPPLLPLADSSGSVPKLKLPLQWIRGP